MMIQHRMGRMLVSSAASATRSKHTTLSITPAVKRSSRLTVRSEGLWTAAARVPPRASPPAPVSAVMKKIVA